MKFWTKRILAAGLGALAAGVSLAAVELILWKTTPDRSSLSANPLPDWVRANISNSEFVADEELFWRPAASHPGLGTNSLGFRGSELPVNKAPGTRRIVCLGDSCTWGYGVAADQAYPVLLQSYLNEEVHPEPVETINAGVPGYSSFQGHRLLRSKILPLSPDAVVLYFGRNDARSVAEEGYVPDAQARAVPRWLRLVRARLDQLRLFQLLMRFWSPGESRSPGGPTGSRTRVSPDEFRSNLLEMIALSRQRGVGIFLVTTPVFPDDVGNYNDLVLSIAEEERIPLFDAAAAFKPCPPQQVLLDDCHPTPFGHRLIARELRPLVLAHFGWSPSPR